jgi:prevent-host-death family protein
MPRLDTNQKGNVAEAEIAAAAVRAGVPVLKPLVEHGRYDLAFDLGTRLARIQCKWASKTEDVVVIRLSGYRLTSRGPVKSTYAADEIDAVAAYCDELDRSYLIPSALVAGAYSLQLRVNSPRNGQKAALHWATDYELPGAIAQLGERLSGTQEVAGSSPASSTSPPPTPATATLGAHDFRNRFGWYFERAAQGETFLITRRGKPYANLGPAQPTDRAGASPQSCSRR